MNLTLRRIRQNAFATYGELFSDDGHVSCVTLELPWKDNLPNVSCVPSREYVIERYDSPEHGDCFLLFGVPNRLDVELHVGCLPSDSRGCILLGSMFGYVEYPDGRKGDGITGSHPAFERFMAAMHGIDRASLTIIDDYATHGEAL